MAEQPLVPETANAANGAPGNGNSAVQSTPARPKRVRPVRFRCVICGRERPARDITQLDVVRPSLFDRIKADNPDLPAEGYICSDDLDRFRLRYVSELLGQERGELTKLEEEVVQSLADDETLAENIEAEWSAGERWANGYRIIWRALAVVGRSSSFSLSYWSPG